MKAAVSDLSIFTSPQNGMFIYFTIFVPESEYDFSKDVLILKISQQESIKIPISHCLCISKIPVYYPGYDAYTFVIPCRFEGNELSSDYQKFLECYRYPKGFEPVIPPPDTSLLDYIKTMRLQYIPCNSNSSEVDIDIFDFSISVTL